MRHFYFLKVHDELIAVDNFGQISKMIQTFFVGNSKITCQSQYFHHQSHTILFSNYVFHSFRYSYLEISLCVLKNSSAKHWFQIHCFYSHEIGSHLLVSENDEDQDFERACFKNLGSLTIIISTFFSVSDSPWSSLSSLLLGLLFSWYHRSQHFLAGLAEKKWTSYFKYFERDSTLVSNFQISNYYNLPELW